MICLLKKVSVLFWVTALLLSGCAFYHPRPLTAERMTKALAPPGWTSVGVLVKTLRHPILKPIPFDAQDGLSPEEAAVLAVIANPSLRAVRDERGIAAAQLLQAGILPNPVLTLSMEHPSGGLTAGTINAYGSELDWEITSLITRSSRKKAAGAQAAAVDLTIAWREWQAAQEAKLHCFRLYWTGKKVSLLKEAARDLSWKLRRIEKGVADGFLTEVDRAAAQSAWREIKLRLAGMEEEREKERLALNRAVGFPPDRVLPLQEITPSPEWLTFYEKEEKPHPEERRLDLMALKMGYQSQEEGLRTAVLSQFPTIGIGLIHARDTGDVITTGPAVTFEFPLFDRGQGRIAKARATRKKLFDEYTARLFEARSQIAGIEKEAESVQNRIEVEGKAEQVQRHLVEIYGRALKEGNGDILTFYAAENNHREKEMALLDFKEHLTDLGVALETASGRYLPLIRMDGQGRPEERSSR